MRKFGLLLVMGIMAVSSSAKADIEPSDTRKPLLIVRFNQPNVYFERALKQAVVSAEKAKPGVMYEIVSVVPSNTRNEDANYKEAVNYNLGTVTSFMQQLGVPSTRMQASSQVSGAVKSQEVQLYVR